MAPMDNNKKKKETGQAIPKRKPGVPVERPHISRANPLADLFFGSITSEMVEAAGRGEEWPSTQTEESLQGAHQPEASISELANEPFNESKGAAKEPISHPQATGLQDKGFLAIPHPLLDRIFIEITNFAGFKVYIYLYREAFRRVHDERLGGTCTSNLTTITKHCTMPNSVVREALKALVQNGWIETENRPGKASLYMVNRSINPPASDRARSASSDPADRADRANPSPDIEKFSTTPAQSGGLPRHNPADYIIGNFLAFPHNLLEKSLLEIRNTTAFKIYFYLYREAFSRIHDERLSARYQNTLATLTHQCALSDRGVRKALQLLARAGWIKIERCPGQASFYVVNRPTTPAQSGGPPRHNPADIIRKISKKKEGSKESSKKGEAAVEKHSRYDDSLSVIKEVYEELTQNSWTAKDTISYRMLAEKLQAEDIIRYLRVIFERTTKPIGSFAYFVKAILTEHKSPNTRKKTMDKLRKIVEKIRTAHIGGRNYSDSDFREDIKVAAAEAGIAYTPDLLNEALKSRAQD